MTARGVDLLREFLAKSRAICGERGEVLDFGRREGAAVDGEAAEQAVEGVGLDMADLDGTAVDHVDVGGTGDGSDGEVGSVGAAVEDSSGAEVGVSLAAGVEAAVEVGAGLAGIVGDGDALPGLEGDGRGADGGLHAIGLAGAGAAGGGDVRADLLGAVVDAEIEKEAVLAEAVFIPETGDGLAHAGLIRSGAGAFDPGDDADLGGGSVKIEEGAVGAGNLEPGPGSEGEGAGTEGASGVVHDGNAAAALLQNISAGSGGAFDLAGRFLEAPEADESVVGEVCKRREHGVFMEQGLADGVDFLCRQGRVCCRRPRKKKRQVR